MKRIPLGDCITEDDSPHLAGFIHGGDGNTWCPEVWRRLIDDNGVRSVVDIGCGEGVSLGWFIDSGMDAVGIDGSEAAIAMSLRPEAILCHDFQTGAPPISRSFDLGWCAEFVEHVAACYMGNFLPLLASCQILAMTHAAPGQDGWHHVNCQPDGYWESALADCGMVYDEAYSTELRAMTLAAHVSRSLMVFRKQA